MPKTKTPPPTAWWEQAEEVPREGLEDAETLNRKARRWRLLVKASLILAPLTLVIAFLAVGSGLTNQTVQGVAGPDRFKATRPVAMQTVEEWLGTMPQPLPGGTVLGWESARVKKYRDVEKDELYRVDLHRIALGAPGGQLFYAEVPVSQVGEGGVALAQPSLIPAATLVDAGTPLYLDLDTVTTTEDIDAAIEIWAAAYTSPDPAELRRAAQDPDETHIYTPLVGAALRNTTINEAVALWGDTPIEERTADMPPMIAVNVTFDIYWVTQKVEEDQEPATITMDLLIADADNQNATPHVVAWGGSGTGPFLKPYGNAITGEIEVEEPIEPDDDQVVTQLPPADGEESADPTTPPLVVPGDGEEATDEETADPDAEATEDSEVVVEDSTGTGDETAAEEPAEETADESNNNRKGRNR